MNLFAELRHTERAYYFYGYLWYILELIGHYKSARLGNIDYRGGKNPGYDPGRCGYKPHRIGAVGNSAYQTRGAKVSIYFYHSP